MADGARVHSLGLTYRTYRIYHRRIADEQRRVAEWTQLHRDSTEVLARAIQAKDEAAVVTLSGCSTTQRHWPAGSTCPISIDRLSRSARCSTTSGNSPCPSTSVQAGPADADERKKMQMHAQIGARSSARCRSPAPLLRSSAVITSVGTGRDIRPDCAVKQIPIGARILSVVDCFDALTSGRPYRPAMSKDAAIRISRPRLAKLSIPPSSPDSLKCCQCHAAKKRRLPAPAAPLP